MFETNSDIRRQVRRKGQRLVAALTVSAALACAGCSNNAPENQLKADLNPEQVAANNAKMNSLIRVADAANVNGDADSAAALYGRVLQEKPDHADVNTSLGQTLLAKGDSDQALAYFKKAASIEPNKAENFIGAGQAYLDKQQPKQAQEEFEKAVSLEPQNTKALNGLGVTLDSIGKHDAAQENYKKALELAPNDKSIRNNYGLSLALSHKHDDAVKMLDPIAKDDSEYGKKARQNLVLSYAMKGDLVTAARLSRIDMKNDDDIRHDLKVYSSIR